MRSKSAPIGIDTHADRPVAEVDDLARHRRAELLGDGGEKVALIARQLEREQIVVQQAFEDVLAPGTDAQPIDVGPRNVPEQRRAKSGRRSRRYLATSARW